MTLFTIEKITQKEFTSAMHRETPSRPQQESIDTILPNIAFLQNDQGMFQRSPSQRQGGHDDDRNTSPNSNISSSPGTPGSQGVGSPVTPDKDKKPPHSYIALIAMAILNSPNKRLLLSDIYMYIQSRYPFYRNNNRSWRNSIRHNLSLNECFIKCGRSGDGRGNFWGIHPANLEDFSRSDYRRRRARRRVRAAAHDLTPSFLYHPCNSPIATYSAPVGFVPMSSTTLPPYSVVPPAPFYPPPVSVPYTIPHAMLKPQPYFYTAPNVAIVAPINSISAPVTSTSLTSSCQLRRGPPQHHLMASPVSQAVMSPITGSAFSFSSTELSKCLRSTSSTVSSISLPTPPVCPLPFSVPTSITHQAHWDRTALHQFYSASKENSV